MKTMTLKEFREAASQGQIFTVRFIKRTTNEERTMNARFGVTKHLKGGELGYDPSAHGLMGCFDVQSGGYRMINLSTLIDLKFQKMLWKWDKKKFVTTDDEAVAG